MQPTSAPASKKPWGLLGAGALLALAKGKSLLLLLKAVPLGKFLLTGFSMLAMVAFEARRSGVWFAVGFVLLILVHELGHGYAMRRLGVAAGWPLFIPFFGAMIAMKGAPRDRDEEAQIAYGGPLVGTVASLAVAAWGLETHSRLLLALGHTGFFLNLFNMTPLSPLDGGRIAQAFSRRAWWLGLALLAALFFYTRAPGLLLIGALALPRLLRGGMNDEREELTPELQRLWTGRYFGLCIFLSLGIYFTAELLES